MKKLFSLVKASMTDGMSLIKVNGNKKNRILSLAIIILLMLSISASTTQYFKQFSQIHQQYILLVIVALGVSIFTLIEGIYKTSSLLFNCHDDQLLLSLPIKRKTILFLRMFKFYVFELLFNSIFMLPFIISYVFWADSIAWHYLLTSFVMLLLLPVIPVVLSCLIGFIISGLSSRFKYKNVVQTIISVVFLFAMMYISFNMDKYSNYLMNNATSINDLIAKIYYPAGVYGKLLIDFNCWDLIMFIFINGGIIAIALLIMSRLYFKINSRTKQVTKNKEKRVDNLVFKSNSKNISFIKKELKTFFNIPVFIINSGFALMMFIVIVIAVSWRFNSILPIFTAESGINLSKDLIMRNISLFILILISFASYLTSITNSVISLEGRNLNILKSLPISPKAILMAKIYACLTITTPVLAIGSIILFIKFKIKVLEAILLLFLTILIPLVSHFSGLIINLKFPKLDATNSAEIIKQSTSSLLSVLLNIILFIITVTIITNIIGKYSSLVVLVVSAIVYLEIDIILYLYLINQGINDFNKLSI